ncbi:MAG: hypothetical protein QME96_15220 [Myxococcota bacterium]|nr:hypothetical protein [Myxococcota bacterium]
MPTSPDRITIDGTEYVRADLTPIVSAGHRAVVVIDRGWIYAGDVTEKDGRIYLDRAVWVFRWERIGLDGMIKNPKAEGVDLRPMPTRIDIPAGAEVFRLPVQAGWGL